MDHYKKALREQIQILATNQATEEAVNVEFVRAHALSIVQLCDQLTFVKGADRAHHKTPGGSRNG